MQAIPVDRQRATTKLERQRTISDQSELSFHLARRASPALPGDPGPSVVVDSWDEEKLSSEDLKI